MVQKDSVIMEYAEYKAVFMLLADNSMYCILHTTGLLLTK